MRAYAHVPFCRQKCGYCKFALTPFVREAQVARYFTALIEEIGRFFDAEGDSAVPVETLYFGGGTPSAVPPERLASVVEAFRTRAGIRDDAEITAEANPEDLTPELCRAWKALGVTRLSVGVQSLDDGVLATVGRKGADATFRGLDAAFSAGFENVGCDLILGLPGERAGGIPAAVESLFGRFSLTHVSAYLLEDGRYPADWEERALPAEIVREDFLAVSETLAKRGFRHYEISNFAKPGFESKHNLGYWRRLDTRGFGLSAASLWKGRRFENAASFSGYFRGERTNEEALSPEQVRLERMLCGFRVFDLESNLVENRGNLERFKAE